MVPHPFPWEHDRRYNSYTEYFCKQFGRRVQKISVDAGFTCPNRDGTAGLGGCTYCNNDAFNPSYCSPAKTISLQLSEGTEFHRVRYRRASNYLAYFQAYSNTYAPLVKLKQMYEEALNFPGVVGLVIGTRPDCIDNEKLDYFAKLGETHYIILEYGIESCYDRTLSRINRGHTFSQAQEAIRQTALHGIKTGAHIIFGLPGELESEMLAEAEILSQLPLNNIKFHQLQIVKDTAMAVEYASNPEDFHHFSLGDYIDFIIRFVEKLNPAFVIERFSGEVPPRFLAGPGWGLLRTNQVNVMIEKELEKRDTWQGKFYCSQ
ncbi:MAG TPA: TIGR01212 family radical SAM protein [Bacteroidales bacterium]